MTTHVDVDLANLEYTKLSNPFLMLTFDLNEELRESEPLSFLNTQNEVKVTTVETGRLTAVVYWFEFSLCEGIKISTLDSTLPWKQAAIMNKSNALDVFPGQELDLTVCLKNSCISVKIDSSKSAA